MLRFDRYYVAHARAIDLASGRLVSLESSSPLTTAASLFQARGDRTLIDFELDEGERVEIWEHWVARRRPLQIDTMMIDFVESLECARLGAPRAFDLTARGPCADTYIRRLLAREARVRGWVPICVEVLAALCRQRSRPPAWLLDRSLVVFVDLPGVSSDAVLALLQLARRDARPHLLVRTLSRGGVPYVVGRSMSDVVVHEAVERLAPFPQESSADADCQTEARARWQWLLSALQRGQATGGTTVQLAHVLLARGQPFEARALAESVSALDADATRQAAAVVSAIDQRRVSRAMRECTMVDDFVDVLQMCQEIEDEQRALSRVGAFLCERLQASSVAFVARDGPSPRVLTRIGSTMAGVELAVRAIETGVSVAPSSTHGPVESACPVRHASEVIGALWCRWSAGTPVAPQQASTLLGVAAAAVAPSLKLAIIHTQVASPRDNPVPELVGVSSAMVAVRDAIVRAAGSPFPVVVEGESGSGKELAARAIHGRSSRRSRRFSAINCAALVDDLVEAELFGHARGAYTGAIADRPGMFEDAAGGTLFLDEIAELSARAQAKLLRVLQEGEVRRVGETTVRKVDVRIVAATNRPLAAAVAAGAFRADLWYRLDVVRITLPPLRERIEDLPVLTDHLWQTLTARTGSRSGLAPAAMGALAAYPWPGNIRELQNVLASMLVSAGGARWVGPSALPVHVARAAASERGVTLAAARRQFEERYVRAALARSGGRTHETARSLGVSRQGLHKLMGRLGIA